MKLTIDKKITMFIVSMIVTLAAVLGVYFVRNQARLLSLELDERASVLLNNLSLNMEYPALVRDREAIVRLVKGVLAQKDVVFCRVEGKAGEVLYQDGASKGAPVREFSSAIITKRIAGGAEALILDAPKETREEIGRIYLGVSLAGLNQKIYDVQKTILTVVIAGIVLSSVGAYLLLKYILGTPIALLVEATERISEGNLDHRIPIESRDELGALANSFNRMTNSLLEAQEELVRKEKLAILGELAGGVGNELRNPLGVMSNAVYFLKMVLAETDETTKEYLEIIKLEIDNSQRIISDFIDFFRTKKPQSKVVEVHEFINRSVKLSAIPVNVTLRVDIPEDLPAAHIDPSQMGQVFQNLITNAIQAMPEGGELRIAARVGQGSGFKAQSPEEDNIERGKLNVEPDGDFTEISVTDTGTGIAPENMEKVFQPLFTTKSRGIGLGLVVCRNLTEANGGRIEVESEMGKGTTVTVKLPVDGCGT